MKTYRINKYAERLAQGTGFAPELIYNISLVRFQGRNGRCIAAWTPGMKRPRYVYKAHTPEEYDKAMERIRQEAERFRRHDEAQEKAAAAFRESLRVGDILYSSWGWEQTNIDFYQVVAIRGSAVDLRQLDQRTYAYENFALCCRQGQSVRDVRTTVSDLRRGVYIRFVPCLLRRMTSDKTQLLKAYAGQSTEIAYHQDNSYIWLRRRYSASVNSKQVLVLLSAYPYLCKTKRTPAHDHIR